MGNDSLYYLSLADDTKAPRMCLCEACTSEFEKSTQLNAANVVSLTANAPAFRKLFLMWASKKRDAFCYDTRSHNTAADRVIYSLKRATNRDATVFLSRLLAERISSDFTREGVTSRIYHCIRAAPPRFHKGIRQRPYESCSQRNSTNSWYRACGSFKSKVTSAQKRSPPTKERSPRKRLCFAS